MRAVVIDSLNSIPYLTEVPEPTPLPGTSRIKVDYAGLQPTDILRVLGTYKDPVFPYIIGGEGVGRLDSGQRVYFGHSVPQQGAFSEYTIVPDEEIWPIAEDEDAAQVIALAIAGTGALIPLEQAEICKGEQVLILGATGPLGQIACLAARRLGGGTIIGAARRVEPLERLLERGLIDRLVQLGQGDDENALRAQTDRGYEVVLDCLFGAPAEAAMRITAEGGRMMSIGTRAGKTMTLTLRELRRRVHHGVDTGWYSSEIRKGAFDRLLAYAREGSWHVDIVPFDIEQSVAAWHAQAGSPGGKIVVKVGN